MEKDFNINDVLDSMEKALVEIYIEEGEAIERDLNGDGDDSMYDGYLTTKFELTEEDNDTERTERLHQSDTRRVR